MANTTKAREVAQLIARYMSGKITPEEHDRLDEWVGESDRNMKLFEDLTDERKVQQALQIMNPDQYAKKTFNKGFIAGVVFSAFIIFVVYILLNNFNLIP